jgi:flagellar motility protein MotE (MotC chaperone)
MGGSPRSMHINRTSEQPNVVQNALRPIKEIQNCDGVEYNCFTLRLMSKSLNITKGKAITRWIESRQKWSEGKPLPRVDLQDAFGKCTALKNGEIDESEAHKLAAELQKSQTKAASDFEGFLQTRAEELDHTYQDYRDLAKRLEKLEETIKDLSDEFENECGETALRRTITIECC